MVKNVKIRDAMFRWGLQTCGEPSDTCIERALRSSVAARLNTGRIAEDVRRITGVEVKTSTIRYYLSKYGIETAEGSENRGKVFNAVSIRGYSSVSDYFLKNPTKTLVGMASELNVSLSTIQRYYRNLVSLSESKP